MLIRKLSTDLCKIVSLNYKISDSEKVCLEYCIQITIKRLLFLVVLLIFGILTKRFSTTFLFLIVFIPIRSFCGGAHAPTPFICSILSYGISLLCILLIPFVGFKCPHIITSIAYILSFIAIMLFAPVDTYNKRLNKNQRKKLKFKCHLSLVITFCLYTIFSIFRDNNSCMTISICVMISAVSVIIGYFQNTRRTKNEAESSHL